jgi:hypothetical protein
MLRFCHLTFCFLLIPGVAHAKPVHKQALIEFLGPLAEKSLMDCRYCHLPTEKEADEERPHNTFGKRLAALRTELRSKQQPIEISTRLSLLANEDSDGDGFSNLEEWISGHFPGDASDRPTQEELAKVGLKRLEFQLWIKRDPWKPLDPPIRPNLPAIQSTSSARNPVDLFIRKQLEDRGIPCKAEASKEILLRRIYHDLIGIPPTPMQQQAFLNDGRSNAYEQVVEQLLRSPQYGERWGRHWMDIWRYSDWAGFGQQVRDSQPHIWHWRDWIIGSLNRNKPYDQMIHEMLAADEIAPTDPDKLRATGFLVRQYKLLSREKWLSDVVEHSFMAFQGMTIQCAKCHDHMYDPISQNEYYQVRAIFEPYQVRTDRLPGQADIAKDGLPRGYDANLDVPTYFLVRGDDRNPDKSKVIQPGIPTKWNLPLAPPQLTILPRTSSRPDRLTHVIAETKKDLEQKAARQTQNSIAVEQKVLASSLQLFASTSHSAPALTRLGIFASTILDRNRLDNELAQLQLREYLKLDELESLEENGTKQGNTWTAIAKQLQQIQRKIALLNAKRELLEHRALVIPHDEKGKKAHETKRIELSKKVDEREKTVAQPSTTEVNRGTRPNYPEKSTGRRTAFAKWLTDLKNPLTARVAVNHLWQRHFGVGIVPTTNDFGKNGRPASHPALLDWLAVELMQSNWDLQQIQRLIVTSATYRQASTPDEIGLQKDPDNIYLWRFSPRRLEAEVVRDSVLSVSDTLDQSMSGPDIDHQLGLTSQRKSLYFRHAPEKQMEFLRLFDVAAATECYQRRPSIQPQQALAMFNSSMTIQNARKLAERLSETAPNDLAFIKSSFESILSRIPRSEEISECQNFLDQSKSLGTNSSFETTRRARENLILVLLNHHEFVMLR